MDGFSVRDEELAASGRLQATLRPALRQQLPQLACPLRGGVDGFVRDVWKRLLVACFQPAGDGLRRSVFMQSVDDEPAQFLDAIENAATAAAGQISVLRRVGIVMAVLVGVTAQFANDGGAGAPKLASDGGNGCALCAQAGDSGPFIGGEMGVLWRGATPPLIMGQHAAHAAGGDVALFTLKRAPAHRKDGSQRNRCTSNLRISSLIATIVVPVALRV